MRMVTIQRSAALTVCVLATLLVAWPGAVRAQVDVLPAGDFPPVLDSIGVQSFMEGDTLSLAITAVDKDLETITLTAESLPDSATFDDNGDGTGLFSFPTDLTRAGIYNVTFIATSVDGADSEVVAITVVNVVEPGEDVDTAIVIPSLPFLDSGRTTTFLDDYYDTSCGNKPGSPDIVYSYSPTVDEGISVILCGSGYDTKVSIYADSVIQDSVKACNDDSESCGTGSAALRSALFCVPVTAGKTYLIVVDGFNGASGEYFIKVESCPLADSIIVASMKVPLGGKDIGIPVRIVNKAGLRQVTLPLEIREITAGAFIDSLGLSYAGRLDSSVLGKPPFIANQYTVPGTGPCPWDVVSDSSGTKQAVPDALVGVLFRRTAAAGDTLRAGADLAGSMILTIDIDTVPGTFEIDSNCTLAEGSLSFLTSDSTLVVPAFVKGIITINDPPVAVDTCIDLEQDSSVAFRLPGFDPDGDSLMYKIVTGPLTGDTVSFNSVTGDVVYHAPAADTVDTLWFLLFDGYNDSDTATVCFHVAPPPPVIDSVIVASMKVPLGARNVEVPVRIVNKDDLDTLAIPLEIREVTPGAFVDSMALSYSERLVLPAMAGLVRTDRYADPDPDPDSACRYITVTDTLGTKRPVVASPEGVLFQRGVIIADRLSAGADTVGSIILTFDVASVPGTFEIDSTCAFPESTVSFITSTDQLVFPVFVKGVITINAPPVASDTCAVVTVGDSIALVLPAFDPDGDTLTYTILSGPSAGSMVNFDSATGAFDYVAPTSGAADTLLFIVADGYDVSDTAVFCVLIVPPTGTLYVSVTGSDLPPHDGSESLPFATIGFALSRAFDSTVLLVGPGVYEGPVVFPPHKSVHLRSQEGEFATAITGDGSGSVVVIAADSADLMHELRGFTIRDNTVTDTMCTYCAGGVTVAPSTRAWILNNIITGNTGWAAPGGLQFGGDSGIVANNWIVGNTGVSGGGMAIEAGATATVLGNTMARNRDSDSALAGAVVVRDATGLIVFDNNIMAFNTPGSGFATDGFSITGITSNNCLYFGNEDSDAVPGSLTLSSAWVFADPLFQDTAAGDYHLSCFSPARDVGRLASAAAITGIVGMDIDGQARIFGSIVDIGADQFVDTFKKARFTPSVTAGCAPLTVDFANASECRDEDWAWDFGDGTTGTAKNPSHQFVIPGTYPVRLIAFNDFDADTASDTIRVGQSLAGADFSADTAAGCTPLAVVFTAAVPGVADEFRWDFGDGAVDTTDTASVGHEYAGAGNYTVTLTIISSCDTVTVTKADYVAALSGLRIDSLTSSFDTDTGPRCNPYEVQFTYAANLEVHSFQWDFGDNSTSVDSTPLHIYAEADTYSVRLIVVGDCGADTLVRSDYIELTARPTVTPSAAPLFACAGTDAVTFEAVPTGTGTALWLFGDGQTAAGLTVVHTYASVGRFLPAVEWTHACGVDTVPLADSLTIGAAPAADFSVSSDSLYEPDAVTFTDLTTSGPIVWLWDLGGGVRSDEQNPTRAYTPGVYATSLIAANPCGIDTTAVQTLRVGGFAPAIVDSAGTTADTIRYDIEVQSLILPYDHPVHLSARLTSAGPFRGSMTFGFATVSAVPPFATVMTAVPSGDLSSGDYTIELTATDSLRFGGAPAPITKTATQALRYIGPIFIRIEPSILDLDSIVVNDQVFGNITISNAAQEHDLKIESVTASSGPFSVEPGSADTATLGPGQNLIVTVRFHPTAEGSFDETLRIISTDPSARDTTISLVGVAKLEFEPPQVIDSRPLPDSELLIDQSVILEFSEIVTVIPLDTALDVRSRRTGAAVPGSTVFINDSIAEFRPVGWFLPDDTLSLTLDPVLSDIRENRMAEAFTMEFTTGPGVYPGDTDDDGRVDERDILPLGQFWGMTGMGRDDDGTEFALQPASARGWEDRRAVRADADGSGTVDSLDVCPIARFFDTSATGLAKLQVEEWLAEVARSQNDKIAAMLGALSECPGGALGHSILGQALRQMQGTPAVPRDFSLDQNYPNPFNPSTIISYVLPEAGHVRLEIFDLRGRVVTVLEDAVQTAGRHWKVWDGRDVSGNPMASGVYFYRLVAGDFRSTRKMVLLK